MKSCRISAVLCGVVLCALSTVAAAGEQLVCRTCSNAAKQVSPSVSNGSTTSRNSGRVLGVFQTRSRTDMRSSWHHTHPKWSAGRKATGAAYRQAVPVSSLTAQSPWLRDRPSRKCRFAEPFFIFSKLWTRSLRCHDVAQRMLDHLPTQSWDAVLVFRGVRR